MRLVKYGPTWEEFRHGLIKGFLRRPLRICVVVALCVAGGVFDAKAHLWNFPIGIFVMGFGVCGFLVNRWSDEALDQRRAQDQDWKTR